MRPHAAGEDVARLHSGDLSIWSAVAEQVRRLEARGIPYTLTPGVPAFAAAAAALGRELTIPEVAQSLVLTRRLGPGVGDAGGGEPGGVRGDRRDAGDPPRGARDRAGGGGADARSMARDARWRWSARATWPAERIVRGTLGTIEAALAEDPIDRTAIIFVGRALAAEGFRDSALYDAGYQRRFRGRAGA